MALQSFEGNLDHFNPATPYAGDEKTPVQFYMGVEKDEIATLEAGRPIYKDVEFIKIFNSKDNILDRPVRDTDRMRWSAAYERWKRTGESVPGATGTLLEHWPALTRAQVEELKYFKVFTVEQLAEVPDTQAQTFHGIQRLKALAKAHVEAARGEAPLIKLQAALDQERSARIAVEDQLAKLAKRLERLTTKEA